MRTDLGEITEVVPALGTDIIIAVLLNETILREGVQDLVKENIHEVQVQFLQKLKIRKRT